MALARSSLRVAQRSAGAFRSTKACFTGIGKNGIQARSRLDDAPVDEWAEQALVGPDESAEAGADEDGNLQKQSSEWASGFRGDDKGLPTVAVVGRPNVGKSALFNRLTGKQKALVVDDPGVTRDRLYGKCEEGEFMLVDTGGLTEVPAEESKKAIAEMGELSEGVRNERGQRKREGEQLKALIGKEAADAVRQADAILVVTDGQAGPTPVDEDIIKWIGREFPEKPWSLAVNKCESPTEGESQAIEFWEISNGAQPHAVSAISGSGTADVVDELSSQLPEQPSSGEEPMDEGEEEMNDAISLAVLGRPNAGKSSLVNTIAGKERAIVSGLAGTTRDSVDTMVVHNGQRFRLVDTAGLRRRSRVKGKSGEPAEGPSVGSALRAVQRADVVTVVVDAGEGPAEQDYKLARYAAEQGKAVVVVCSKADMLRGKQGKHEEKLREYFFSLPWAVYAMASTRGRKRAKASATEVLKRVRQAAESRSKRIPTSAVNEVVQEATTWHPPPSSSGRRGKVYFATQAGVNPPSFVLFVNNPGLFSDSYRRYLERRIREAIGLEGTPLRLFLRERERSPAGGSSSSTSSSRRQSSYTRIAAF